MNDTPPEPGDVRRSRPSTEASYGIPDDRDGLLPWTFVTERMTRDRSFWVITVRPDGFPHARPTWGVWVDETFYCGGGENTRWVRNLARRTDVVVHREDAEAVVVIEGRAERIDFESADRALIERIDSAYETKYDVRHGTPFFAVRPTRVLAWHDFPTDATRWVFDE